MDVVMDQGQPAPENNGSGMVREEPQLDEATKSHISAWQGKLIQAKKFWSRNFDRMRADMDFAGGQQWVDQSEDDERYVANFIQRHIQQRTASLYAKNPRFFYKRKRKLDFELWDGSMQSLQEAIMQLQGAQQMAAADPMSAQMALAGAQQAMALIQDVEMGRQAQRIADRVGRTLELVAEHEISEQKPPFKTSMKQLVRRTLSCAVGYVKIGFERATTPRPDDMEKVRDYTQQISKLDQLIADAQDGECTEEKAEREQLKILLEQAQSGREVIVREGIVFDFPMSNSIIMDPRVRQIKGFVGARWVAQEFKLHPDDVKQIYGIDIKAAKHTTYVEGDARKTDFSGMISWTGHVGTDASKDQDRDLCAVWEIQDRDTGTTFTLADGYMGYLRAPAPPEVQLERFWTIFALSFNDLENDRDVIPPSDVHLLKHIQLERNRSREALREHRIAARPAMVSTVPLDDEDKVKLQTHPANAVIELQAAAGQDVGKILQPIQKPGVDPNLYTTDYLDQDRSLVSGSQDAALGLAGGSATATETSIAEGSRMTSVGSNVDDLDDFLQEIGHAMGQVLLTNMSPETVKKIAGRGAVWPQLSMAEIAEDLILEVEAGSSGRPNRAAEIANAKEIFPMLIQVPDIDPKWIAKELIKRLDDKMNIEEAFLEGMPPIAALGRMMTPMGGGAPASADPGSDPAQQGGAGANNTPQTPGSEMQGPPTPAALAGPGLREPFRSNMAPTRPQ